MADQTSHDYGLLGNASADLVSTQKSGVQNLGRLVQAITNALPIATASISPVTTPVNNLGTTGTTIVGSNAFRHGIVFHNPSTSVIAYVYQTNATPAPSLSAPGGSFIVLPGETLPFPSIAFSNLNSGFSAFAGTGTNNPLTVVEFL